MDLLLHIARVVSPIAYTALFALLLLTTIVSFSRGRILYDLWLETVQDSRLERLTEDDLLRPWIVRVYQRSYVYFAFGTVLLLLTSAIASQIALFSIPAASILGQILVITRSALTVALSISLLRLIFSTYSGLRAEVRDLQKRFPNHNITFENLKRVNDTDRYLDLSEVFPEE